MSHHDDGPDWCPLADVLAELGMTGDELLRRWPHIDLSHTGLDGETVVDRRELDNGGR